MTTLLVDTSVLIKWFHSEGEAGLSGSRAVRDASARGDLDVRVIDLAFYEMGNVLLRALRWSAADVADQLDDLATICGPPLAMEPAWLRRAATLGTEHGLTFYDASWAAAGEALEVALVTADSKLLAAGLGETPGDVARRLRLPANARGT